MLLSNEVANPFQPMVFSSLTSLFVNLNITVGGKGETTFILETQKSRDFEIGSTFIHKESYYQMSSYLINSSNYLKRWSGLKYLLTFT